MLRAVWAIILAGILTACSAVGGPSSAIVQQAIVVHLNQIHQELGQQLRQEPSKFEVTQVRVDRQQPLKIETLPGVHLQGTYNLTIELPTRKITQEQNPFDLYLQRQPDGKQWNWALPTTHSNSEEIWIIQPLNRYQ